MNLLVDDHGRQIRKIRVSLTDRCNLRCHYCMPIDMEFGDDANYLGAQEYAEILKNLCDRGLEEIRLTGGEPLMRKAFPEILSAIAALPVRKIGLTTNGILLDRHFEHLLQHRVKSINISLDSLNDENFARITHGNHLKRVMSNILKAKELGFHLKINTVAMKGVNDHEILDFVDWSEKNQIEVRFLELMRIGHALENQRSQFISAAEIMTIINAKYELKPVVMAKDSTSFNFITAGGASIGFIASESKAFCGACSRWRLSAEGILRACLLKDEGLSVRGFSANAQNEIFNQVLGMKPGMRPLEVAHAMNQIGG